MNKFVLVLAATILFLGFTGCSTLFYPRADEYAEKAKGANTVETLLNLTNMMEASAEASKGEKGKEREQSFDDLHNQFHAFDNMLCCVEKKKRETPAYDLAVTHNKELWTIFKRIWKFRDAQPQRNDHLDLFITELKELRVTLQLLK